MLQYNGDDSVVYMYPEKRSRTLSDHIAINFKTLEQDGLLLHSEGIQGDLFTLELKKGRLYLHIGLGTGASWIHVVFYVRRYLTIVTLCALGSSVVHKVNGRTTLTAGSLLDNLHWHYVTIKRYGRQVNLTVDSQTVTGYCNGDFTHLDLDKQVPVTYIYELCECQS